MNETENVYEEFCEIIVSNPCLCNRFYPIDTISLNSFQPDQIKNERQRAIKNDTQKEDNNLVNSCATDSFIKPKVNKKDAGDARYVTFYPVHDACAKGDLDLLRFLVEIRQQNPMQYDDDKWYPLHHAAWNDHAHIVKTLIKEYSCSPNVVDNFNMTALHYAALQGHFEVVEELLKCPDTDLHRTVNINVMDGSTVTVELISGSNTTTDQLLQQIFEKIQLNDDSKYFFSLWICSRHLKLQLRSDHKPCEHLADWKRCIVPQLSDANPLKEEPSLYLKRDARLVIDNEKKVRHPWAVRLLCFEAYHNYINSMYPCTDKDVIVLASIFMEIVNDGYDKHKWKTYLSEDKNVQVFVPLEKLKKKSVSHWTKQILKEYEFIADKDLCDNETKLQYKFLMYCWNLTVYGSTFFYAQLTTNKSKYQQIIFGINDFGIHLLEKSNQSLLNSFTYKSIIKYGLIRDESALEMRTKNSRMWIITKNCNNIYSLMKHFHTLVSSEP